MRVHSKICATAALLLMMSTAAAGCGGAESTTAEGNPTKVTIAVGTGIAYAPLAIMKEEGRLEERYPDTKFVWNEGVSGGAATRDGMIAGDIQVGVAGISPFLIGVDKGVKWKVLGSMGQLSIDLVTIDPKIKTLADLDKSGKSISVPSPDSGQAIALKALGKREFGDVKAFDDQLTSMGHPDAYQALITGTTGAAFIGPPFQYRLQDDKGARRLAGAWDVFGPMTYSAIVLTDEFYEKYPKFSKGLYEALEESLNMLGDQPTDAANILSKIDGGKTTPKQYEEWLKNPETEWSATPKGYMENAKFMQSIGLIEKVPASEDDLFFDTVLNGGKK